MSPPPELDEVVRTLRGRLGARRPTVAVVLGSGLGDFADQLNDPVAIPYGELPGFPQAAVEGHRGRLVAGEKEGVDLIVLQGRAHYYEGHELADVVRPIRALIALGARTLVLTNAAGGLQVAFRPGDLVVVTDHLNLTGQTPLRGPNDERLGPRFLDLTAVYDPALRQLALEAARRLGLSLREGIYAWCSGPSYETPAEVRMLRALGADLVGMSTVPEAIAARHMGARVLALSCVTNLAAGLAGHPLSHDEVTETAARVRQPFEALLGEILRALSRGETR